MRSACGRIESCTDSNALGSDVLIFSHRDVLRILAARWLGLPAIQARHFYLATASLSVLSYDHDPSEPVIRAWNEVGHR